MKDKKRNEKKKSKQVIRSDQLKSLLQNWERAIAENQDLEIMMGDEIVQLSNESLLNGLIELKYEQDNGESELELKLKFLRAPDKVFPEDTEKEMNVAPEA